MTFEELYLAGESDMSLEAQAEQLAISQQRPICIYLENQVLIEAKGIEDDQPIYMVITNFLDPSQGGQLMTYSDVQNSFDLSQAYINYGNGVTRDPNGLMSPKASSLRNNHIVLLIPESSNDRIMAFDPQDGTLINANFVATDPTNLSTPIAAVRASNSSTDILVSDQIDDLVQRYSSTGTFVGSHAPVGGINTAVLDNIRGIDIKQNTPGNLLATVGSGANNDAIAEFDINGNFVGNFISNGAGGLNSPFDIFYYPENNEYLVGGITSDAIHRYDLSGAFLGNFANINTFPEQIGMAANSNILVANFSGMEEGINIYSSNGTKITTLDPMELGGYRGIYQLGNGNYLTTNGGGVHEITPAGQFVESEITGVSARFIHEYSEEDIEEVVANLPVFSRGQVFIFLLALLLLSTSFIYTQRNG